MSGVYHHSVIHGVGFFIILFYNIEAMWRKTIKHAFSMGFDQSEHALGPFCRICHHSPAMRAESFII